MIKKYGTEAEEELLKKNPEAAKLKRTIDELKTPKVKEKEDEVRPPTTYKFVSLSTPVPCTAKNAITKLF